MGRINRQIWSKEDLLVEFRERNYNMSMGKGKLSRIYNVSPELIKEVKKEIRSKIPKDLPKILVLDIETAPLESYAWSQWKQNLYDDQIISNWFMLTWSAKWLFGDKVHSGRLTPKEALAEDDFRIVGDLRELLEQADVVIAHNGKRFDIPKINTRMVMHQYKPVKPYQQIDTLLIARKEFGFSSNKLDTLGKMFGVGEKIHTTMALWIGCKRGDDRSLRDMEKYNKQDVLLLEEVYLRMRPFIHSHPNVALFMDADKSVCPTCGSDKLTPAGNYYTATSRFEAYQCECGAISRSRINNYDKDKRKHLIVSIAR